MIMLVGLPGSGKTSWVNKHVEENPDKRYYVIGTSALINKMKVCWIGRTDSSNSQSLSFSCASGGWRASKETPRRSLGSADSEVHSMPSGLAQAGFAEAPKYHH